LQFDTVLFEPQALHFPCGVAGLDRAVLGSDCFPDRRSEAGEGSRRGHSNNRGRMASHFRRNRDADFPHQLPLCWRPL